MFCLIALPGGGDWEVMMLADELEKRERDEVRRMHYPSTLRELEEVTPLCLLVIQFADL